MWSRAGPSQKKANGRQLCRAPFPRPLTEDDSARLARLPVGEQMGLAEGDDSTTAQAGRKRAKQDSQPAHPVAGTNKNKKKLDAQLFCAESRQLPGLSSPGWLSKRRDHVVSKMISRVLRHAGPGPWAGFRAGAGTQRGHRQGNHENRNSCVGALSQKSNDLVWVSYEAS